MIQNNGVLEHDMYTGENNSDRKVQCCQMGWE